VVDLDRPVEAEGLMRPDLVEDLPVGVRLTDEIVEGIDLLPVEVLVLQRAERALADAVLTRAPAPGTDVEQLRAGGDEPGEHRPLERGPVVRDQRDPPDLTGDVRRGMPISWQNLAVGIAASSRITSRSS